VVADGVADDDEWAPFESPDGIATGEGQGLEEQGQEQEGQGLGEPVVDRAAVHKE
jgi:hypothetical protein